jgi:hypothetical protein
MLLLLLLLLLLYCSCCWRSVAAAIAVYNSFAVFHDCQYCYSQVAVAAAATCCCLLLLLLQILLLRLQALATTTSSFVRVLVVAATRSCSSCCLLLLQLLFQLSHGAAEVLHYHRVRNATKVQVELGMRLPHVLKISTHSPACTARPKHSSRTTKPSVL